MPTQSHFLDIYRSMARATNDSIMATLESTQKIHQKQIDIVRSAIEQGQNASRELSQVDNMDDLVSAQSQIIGAQVAQGLETWRSWFRAMGDLQMTFMSQAQNQMSQVTQSARQAYDLTRKATEDATRVAASRVQAGTNGGGTRHELQPPPPPPPTGRPSAEQQHRKP